jgi:hypothetical protein
MIVRRTARLAIVLAGLALCLSAACSVPRDAIVVEGGTIDVENQSSRDWRNLTIRVNDHFTGGAPVLPAGGRLNAQVSQFQTAYGQKFDRGRQSVFKVEVTATDTDGKAIALTWGPPEKQPEQKR